MKIKLLSTFTALALSGIAQAASITSLLPEVLNWQDARELPPGAKVVVLSGDPAKKEPFVARVKLPANYTVPPHSHPVVEYDTVLSGTLYMGVGDKLPIDEGTALPAGSYVKIPKRLVHYVWTKEETILQINGVGPWGIIYKDRQLNKKYI
jgi:quercetin dioxygenase-like cupin family protein